MLMFIFVFAITGYSVASAGSVVGAPTASNCTTPNGESAQCISIYSCDSFKAAIKSDKKDSLDFMRQSECGCSMVCCGTSVSFTNKPTTTTTVKPLPKNWRPLASRRICGFQHTDDRYYVKQETAIDEFPWMAQIRHRGSRGHISQKCAGSLINRRYILTAAHCVVNKTNVENLPLVDVRLGEYDIQNSTDCVENPDYPECSDDVVDVGIEEIIIHPQYRPDSIVDSDIALIRMTENIHFTDFIRPICLPMQGYKNATVGEKLISSGWGHTPIGGHSTRIKKRTINKIISAEECFEYYKKHKIVINKSHICMLEDVANAACIGDSGGPVMTKNNFQWQQDGIISFGPVTCGTPGSIGVNVRVTEYMDWIINTIKP